MKRVLMTTLGTLALGLAILGIFLPLLPTTPLLLLAAWLYLHSSERLYNWLISHPKLGPYIQNFREHRAIPLRVKIVSVSLVWLTLLYCAFGIAKVWWATLLFILLAAGITIHILRFKTLKGQQ